jgi:nucleoside-diphosphate-sugar epimerase
MNFLKNKAYVKDLEETLDFFDAWSSFEGKSFLITGANGLIVSFLIDCLMYRNQINEKKIKIYALCRNKEKGKARFAHYINNAYFELIIQDVCMPLTQNVKFDYILHAASNAHPVAYATEPIDTIKANVIGCINLLEYARKNRLEKFLFISSSEVYGQNNSGDCALQEDYCGYIDCINPRAAYPESKRVAETLCASYYKQYGIECVVARPGYIYGPTLTLENSRADAQFIRSALAGKDIVMKSMGTQRRSYCYVSDMAIAILYLLLRGESGQAYNVASKNSTTTIREFAEKLAEIAKVNIVFENASKIEETGYSPVVNVVLNTAKLENLGWEAKVPLQEGLAKTIEILKLGDMC